MTVSPPPRREAEMPPGFYLDSEGTPRHPGSLTAGGDRTSGVNQLHYLDVLGRAGDPPTEQQYDWVWQTLNNYPDQDEFGNFLDIFQWWRLIGGFNPGDPRPLQFNLFIEMRTPAEVAAAAGPGVSPPVYAVTGVGSPALFPDADGTTIDDDSLTDLGYDDPAYQNFRILIRNDLDTTGAGVYSGQAGFTEVLVHELAHVAIMLMTELYGEEWVKTQFCDCFGRPTSEWDSGPWQNRIVEATAETIKDIAFPSRQHDNRTSRRLPESRFEDFVKLVWDYGYTPYWNYSNDRGSPIYSNDFFHTSPPDGQFVRADDWFQQTFFFISDDYVASTAYNGAMFRFKLPLAWPLEGDALRFRWNFNNPPFGPLWVGTTFGFHPGEDMTWDMFSPEYEAKIGIAARFFEPDYTVFDFKGPEIEAAAWSQEINPELNPDGYGVIEIPLPDPEDTPNGCIIQFYWGTVAWEYPRPDPLYDGPTLPGGIYPGNSSDDWTLPWWEFAGGLRVARWPLVFALEWPYTGPGIILGHVTATPGPPGAARPAQRFTGAGAQPATQIGTSQAVPVSVLDFAQTLDEDTDVIVLVTALGLDEPGQVRIEDGARIVHMRYGTTTDTELHGVEFVGGTAGSYPDGAHVFREGITS